MDNARFSKQGDSFNSNGIEVPFEAESGSFFHAPGGEPKNTLEEIQNLASASSLHEEEHDVSMVMPPNNTEDKGEEKLGDINNINLKISHIGDDGKISGTEYRQVMSDINRASSDPFRLNEAINRTSESINNRSV